MTKEEIIAGLRELYPHGHPDFIPMCIDEMELHSKKNYDYARMGEPLGNFERVADILSNYVDTDPIEVAATYMLKQLDAVLEMIYGNYEGEVEGVERRLQDMGVYPKLMSILYKEGRCCGQCE